MRFWKIRDKFKLNLSLCCDLQVWSPWLQTGIVRLPVKNSQKNSWIIPQRCDTLIVWPKANIKKKNLTLSVLSSIYKQNSKMWINILLQINYLVWLRQRSETEDLFFFLMNVDQKPFRHKNSYWRIISSIRVMWVWARPLRRIVAIRSLLTPTGEAKVIPDYDWFFHRTQQFCGNTKYTHIDINLLSALVVFFISGQVAVLSKCWLGARQTFQIVVFTFTDVNLSVTQEMKISSVGFIPSRDGKGKFCAGEIGK